MGFDFITRAFEESGRIGGYASPIEFAQNEISFAHDVSARQSKFDISLTPYLRDVLEQWDFRGKGQREIVCMGVEQTGKSLSWMLGLVWSFVHEPCLSMVVYPSDEKCDEVNRAKLLPLMKSIPALAAGLEQPKTKAKNRYSFPGFISYFQGAIERISAHSARIRIADEVDDWQQTEGKTESPKLEDLRKRGRSFDDSMMALASSPKGESPLIYPAFMETSQGYWHLRCLGCGSLTMRSADVHNLQFEKEELEHGRLVVVPGSERLVCPKCRHEHVYSDRREMNVNGAYVHKRPELIGKRTGFQWGALASQWDSLSWTYIAEKQLMAGKSGNIKDQANFDNSIRGLPFRPRRDDEDSRESILKHCSEPPPIEDIEAVFLTSDTQDSGWRWELRALDIHSNRYLLDYGNALHIDLDDEKRKSIEDGRKKEAALAGQKYEALRTLGDVLRAGWNGIPVTMCLIDEGGHHKQDVYEFVQNNPRAFSYKGGWKGGFDSGRAWAWSKNQPKLILARRSDFQDSLLYYLHFQKDKSNNYWFLLPREKLSDDYIDELLSVREVPKKREAHLRCNWDHEGRVHDFFDVSMMYLVLEDVAISELDISEFRCKKAEILFRNETDEEDDSEVTEQREKNNFVNSWRG